MSLGAQGTSDREPPTTSRQKRTKKSRPWEAFQGSLCALKNKRICQWCDSQSLRLPRCSCLEQWATESLTRLSCKTVQWARIALSVAVSNSLEAWLYFRQPNALDRTSMKKTRCEIQFSSDNSIPICATRQCALVAMPCFHKDSQDSLLPHAPLRTRWLGIHLTAECSRI